MSMNHPVLYIREPKAACSRDGWWADDVTGRDRACTSWIRCRLRTGLRSGWLCRRREGEGLSFRRDRFADSAAHRRRTVEMYMVRWMFVETSCYCACNYPNYCTMPCSYCQSLQRRTGDGVAWCRRRVVRLGGVHGPSQCCAAANGVPSRTVTECLRER